MKFSFDVTEVKSDRQEAGMRIVEARVHLMTLPVLPDKVNIRNFKPQSPYIRAMKDQLSTKEGGKLFRALNNGISISCATLRLFEDQKRIDVTTEDEKIHGAFNGNHTQRTVAICQQDTEKYPGVLEGEVDMIFYVGADLDTVFQLARASNSGLTQKKNDILNYQGVFDGLFDVIQDRTARLVQRKAGDAPSSVAPYLGADLVRRLALLDNSSYPMESGKHPTRVYNGAGGVSNSFASGLFHDNLSVLQDAIDLEGLIANYIVETSGNGNSFSQRRHGIEMYGEEAAKEHLPLTLLSGTVLRKTPTSSFVMPVLAAFRIFVKDGKFVEPVADLFAKYGPGLVGTIRSQYAGEAFDAFGKSKKVWAAVSSTMLALAEASGYDVKPPKAKRARKAA